MPALRPGLAGATELGGRGPGTFDGLAPCHFPAAEAISEGARWDGRRPHAHSRPAGWVSRRGFVYG
jgi:hypothetical protein